MPSKYPRGSEWRKWDLHVHTPFSLVQGYGDSTSDEVWEEYLSNLESLPAEFKVLGINDYLFLDGYKRLVKEKKDNGRLQNIDLLLPVLEFRIDKFAGVDFGNLKRINLHVIFSNDLDIEVIQSQFLNSLEQGYVLNDGTKWTRSITQATVAELGKNIKKSVPNEKLSGYGSDIKEGFNNLNVNDELIYKTLSSRDCFKDQYLTAVGKTEWDALTWTDSSIATKKSIINSANLVFTSAESVESFERAKQKLIDQGVNSNLLDCSDAHCFSNSVDEKGNPIKDRIGNCFTWIKADPTFEGLRQIIFEPKDRVCIQELKPDDKEVYRIISEVKINDPNFSPTPIPINQNLTVIIGSRSSGKTTLLNSIAKSIDLIAFNSRFNNAKLVREPPTSSVKWEDGAVVPSETVSKGITYIPQNYIINLAEATGGQAPILEIAEKAIFDSKDSVSTQKNQLDGQIESIGISLASEIFRLFAIKNQIITQKEKIKQIGDKAGINEQIRLLDQLIKTLQKNFTTEERETLSGLIKTYTDNKNKIDALLADIELITSEVSRPLVLDDLFQERIINFRSASLLEELTKFEVENKADYLNKYLEFLSTKKNQLSTEKTVLEKTNADLLNSNKDLIAKSKENKTAQDKIKEKQGQEAKLAEIVKEESNLEKLETQFTEVKNAILQAQGQRTQLRSDFVASATGTVGGIKYNAVLEIDRSKLSKYLIDSINFHNSTSCRDELNAIPGYKNGEDLEETALIKDENIKSFLDLILNEKLKTKTGVSIQDAVEGLFADFEYINYSLSYEGDTYPEMTPGKKSLVVLKLLIESSKDKFPILIDQPEDDLDSRSISNEIVNFLRQKKKERQIILVTHNANIAIKADAEEIVIVNRNGTDSKNANNVMFDYLTGAIEYSFTDSSKENILERMGTREHACDLLEGGKEAFENRRNKFNIN